MEEIIKALQLRQEINRMEFDDFIDKYIEFETDNLKSFYCDDWDFKGLNNVDFITMYILPDLVYTEDGKALFRLESDMNLTF